MDASSSSAKLTPEIFRKMQQQVVERMGDMQIPPEAIHTIYGDFPACPHCGVGLNFDGDHAIPGPEYACALLQLWAAVKELNADGTGYTPKLAEAVARLRKLEAGE